jgi:hypothetical protein
MFPKGTDDVEKDRAVQGEFAAIAGRWGTRLSTQSSGGPLLRILVAGPPKTGNVWVEKLFSLSFGLNWIRQAPPYDYWGHRDLSGLEQFIADGLFPPASVVHQHFWPSPILYSVARRHGIHLVTTVRDPYDQFVSWYFYIQNFAGAFVAAQDPGVRAIGKPIDHPDVLDLLAHEFGAFLDQAIAWVTSGTSLVIRYEALHRDPHEVLRAANRRFGLPFAMDVEEAVAGARPDRMRQDGPDMVRHIRSARVGDCHQHLSDAHRHLFRQWHGSRLERLGYPVR